MGSRHQPKATTLCTVRSSPVVGGCAPLGHPSGVTGAGGAGLRTVAYPTGMQDTPDPEYFNLRVRRPGLASATWKRSAPLPTAERWVYGKTVGTVGHAPGWRIAEPW